MSTRTEKATPMSQPTGTSLVARQAFRQAVVELRIQLTGWMALSWLFMPAVGLIVMWFLRDTQIADSEVSLAQMGVAGILTLYLLTGGLMGIAGQLLTEREDGTLLRAKAVPRGMATRLVGDVLTYVVVSVVPTFLLLIAAGALFGPSFAPSSVGRWAWLLVVCLLGLVATLPLGAVLGAWLKGPAMMGWFSLVVYGSLAISGVFYPLSALPSWLQVVGQALPPYWMGLGIRSAMLPDAAAALEVGGSWRTGMMVAVLLGWCVLGLVLAPRALSGMARRQSGSAVTAARDRVLTRGY